MDADWTPCPGQQENADAKITAVTKQNVPHNSASFIRQYIA
jgi:hypothetical protein